MEYLIPKSEAQLTAFARAYKRERKGLGQTPFIEAYEVFCRVKAAGELAPQRFSPADRAVALIVHRNLCTVYFIASVETGLIKIGKTQSLVKRFKAIQSASPCELSLAFAIDYDEGLEERVHAYLTEHRSRGEWFYASPEVLDFIRGVRDNGARWMVERVGDAAAGWDLSEQVIDRDRRREIDHKKGIDVPWCVY